MCRSAYAHTAARVAYMYLVVLWLSMVIYMVICVDNSHLGALQKTPDPSWLAPPMAGARHGILYRARANEGGYSLDLQL